MIKLPTLILKNIRGNLDYLVDEICYILKYIKQLNDNSEVYDETANKMKLGFLNSMYDDRIVRVVGAVFFDLQSIPLENDHDQQAIEKNENFQDITMHLRDLIRDSLDVVDVLCNSSTSYAEISHDMSQQLNPEDVVEYRRGQV